MTETEFKKKKQNRKKEKEFRMGSKNRECTIQSVRDYKRILQWWYTNMKAEMGAQ